MRRQCSVSSCRQQATGFSTHCDAHKQTLRRHGHAEQKGVTVHELRPYQERIRERRAKNPGNPTWALLERRWEALTAHAEATMARYAAGTPAITHERQTAEQLLTLRDSTSKDAVIDTVLALFAMNAHRPTRFQSDKAFRFQVARRVRGLAIANAGLSRDAKSGRLKRTYRDTPPRAMECLAASLESAFGVAGLRLAELDMREATTGEAERRQLAAALKDLQ
ncbi:MAG: hypothetical protein H0W40_02435 [Methylibium sp.]|uniref:hypothetical protein n=1 Tax=Methylibium sp. TaxID=2067992 RepID=UPI0017D58F91|nr:hypothetical protein [Methylibium sp.]MBA3596222.1 hypothetical protein [Methylibium sp.]